MKIKKFYHEDCFAFKIKNHKEFCSALIDKVVNCSNCKFYKTQQEYDEKVRSLKYKNKK